MSVTIKIRRAGNLLIGNELNPSLYVLYSGIIQYRTISEKIYTIYKDDGILVISTRRKRVVDITGLNIDNSRTIELNIVEYYNEEVGRNYCVPIFYTNDICMKRIIINRKFTEAYIDECTSKRLNFLEREDTIRNIIHNITTMYRVKIAFWISMIVALVSFISLMNSDLFLF